MRIGGLLFLVVTLTSTNVCAGSEPGPVPAKTLSEYRELSGALAAADRAAMVAELKSVGLSRPLPAVYAKRFGFDPQQPQDFYRTEEGQRIADIVLSYQTPSGGWSKRTDMGAAPRKAGQAFGVEKNYIPTFDNSATSTQFWVMVRAYNATADQRYADSAARALKLILLAQYPAGGWPQSFPLRGKYHDHFTFNDKVTGDLLRIVHAAARGEAGLEFLPQTLQAQAADSLRRGLQMLVDTQVKSGGEASIWGAQHDPQTLQASAARAFEPAALATAESADLLLLLMELDKPPENIQRVIVSAHDWFVRTQIHGYRWEQGELIADPEAGPLWARFYEIDSNRPVFGDRDGEVYYDVRQVSQERLRGYGWYTESPNKVLKKFAAWKKRHSPQIVADK